MTTGAAPLFGTLTWHDGRAAERDPGSHGAELAMEMQIAEGTGELPSSGGGQTGWSTAWGWLYSLPFVGPKG
jgi:hypothetical protein